MQEASRLSRRIPSIRKNNLVLNNKTNNHHQPHNNTATTSASTKSNGIGASPYYCQEIGPQLDLGYQWPQRPVYEPKGFVKVLAGNTSTRQRQLDRQLLTRRQKVTQR